MKDELFEVKLNKLKPLFQPIYKRIADDFGIHDIRTMCQMVVGKSCSRKELLFYLRSYVENVRGTVMKVEMTELEDKKPLG